MTERVRIAIADYLDGRLSAEQLTQRVQQELALSPAETPGIRALLSTSEATLPVPLRELLRGFAVSSVRPERNSPDTVDVTRLRVKPSATPERSARQSTTRRSAQLTVTSTPNQSETDSEVRPGRVLGGRFRLVRELGRGGTGVVFLADSTVDDQQFAVKVLNPAFRQNPDAIQVLREEARKCLALRHPNIVGVYPLERDGSNYFLPMEYLDGKTLRELLDDDFVRGMPLQQAASIIHGVGAALSFAHDHGVIHRDLKPSNILVTTGGRARVLDFGIARALRGRQRQFDTGNVDAWTESYASCEMLEGGTPDFRDDVYGLACVVYELLTGNHPFAGRSAVEARDCPLHQCAA